MSGEQWDVEILPEWGRAADAILARPGGVVLLGASDSGKTTLCRILAEHWTAAGRTIGLVDGDIGQSSIGPPATVGLAIISPDRPLTFHGPSATTSMSPKCHHLDVSILEGPQ